MGKIWVRLPTGRWVRMDKQDAIDAGLLEPKMRRQSQDKMRRPAEDK